MRTEKQKEASRRNGREFGGAKPRNRKELERDFWVNVNKNGPAPKHAQHLGQCWEWKRSCDCHGYGCFTVNGKFTKAHRFSFAIEHGDFEGWIHVLHACDNPKCVRPSHLFLGTDKDNSDDKIKKGRLGVPPKYPVVTADQTAFIKAHFKPHAYSAPRLSKELGLTLRQVKYAIYEESNHPGLGFRYVEQINP